MDCCAFVRVASVRSSLLRISLTRHLWDPDPRSTIITAHTHRFPLVRKPNKAAFTLGRAIHGRLIRKPFWWGRHQAPPTAILQILGLQHRLACKSYLLVSNDDKDQYLPAGIITPHVLPNFGCSVW
jgi:hypothetical protein